MRELDAIASPGTDVCRRIEHALLEHPSVADCAALIRVTADGREEAIAYVVPMTVVGVDELRDRIKWLSPHPAVQFVQVSSIPLTADGAVDAECLCRLPIPDAGLVQRWEERAACVPDIEHAAVLLDARATRALPLHLSDLLPDWNVASRSATDAHREGPPPGTVASAPKSNANATDALRPSLVAGGPLKTDADEPEVLRDIIERAASSGRDLVYVESDDSAHAQSYRVLLERASRILAGLQVSGFGPGDRIVLQLERHQDFIEVFWACMLGGLVPVPLAVPPTYEKSSAPLQTLQAAWDVVLPSAVITMGRSVDALVRATERVGVRGVRALAVEDLHLGDDGRRHRGQSDDVALLMLTSGSTGTPKAVQLTHRNILTRTAASRQFNAFSETEVTLNWMPLDHVAGLIYFHIRDVYLGCRQIHIPTGSILQQPLKWIDYLDRYKATVTFAPNFAFALVNDHADEVAGRSWDLSSVRMVLNGAEAIVARTARRFLKLLAPYGLRPSCMRPAWGMSETSSGVIYSDTFSLDDTSDADAFVEVGRPIPTLSIRIVDDTDRLVAEGQIGRLQVQGPTVTPGYFGAPQATEEAFTSDGWFKTGDLGRIQQGRLTISGREKDVVIINSVNYYCHAIEAVVEELDGVETSYTAACAVRPQNANTDRLAIFFHALDSDPRVLADLLARIRAAVSGSIGIAPDYLLPVECDAILKTSLGKIQRAELSRRLVEGEFDEVLKFVDRITSSANTIPDWFYRKVWRRKDAAADSSLLHDRATALIFVDDEGVGRDVCAQLDMRGVCAVTVDTGEAFEQIHRCAYRINPRAESDYQRLMRTLAGAGLFPRHIVHLWGCARYAGEAIAGDIEGAQFTGAISAISLAKALAADASVTGDVGLTFVASYTQRVCGTEPVAYERTPAIGLLKSLSQEMPSLRCRHVDVELDDPHAAAACVVQELGIRQHDREIAYRDGRRYVAALEKVAFQPDARCESRIAHGGTYLLTGGMGGIGEHLAEFLLDRFNANLLLVGRRHLEGERADAFQRLRQRGGSIAYAAVDVCDERALNEVVERYQRQSGVLDGIIHLAGTYYERLVEDESADTFLAMLRPKTIGTDILHRLLARQGRGFLLSSSSVAGFFGGGSIGAYSAANRFQEAFAEHFHDRGDVRHYCVSWSNWNDIGQSRSYQRKESPRARGYCPLELAEALQSLRVALIYREPALIVGLDGSNRNIQRYTVAEPETLERLALYYTSTNGMRGTRQLRTLDVRDRFGVRSSPDLLRVSELPVTCSGAVDKDRLASQVQVRDERIVVEPETEAERHLVEIWRQVLGVPSVSCDDNFFDLGGDSLLAARLLARIRETFGRELSLRAIFDAATLRELAGAAFQGQSVNA